MSSFNSAQLPHAMDYSNIINLRLLLIILQSLTKGGVQTQEYSQVMTVSNGHIVNKSLPTCGNGKIKLLAYEYHHCVKSHPCSKPLKTSLSRAAKLVIHEMCSLKRTCTNLQFPTADLSLYETTTINLTYQCLDQFTTFVDICANSTRTENKPVHLLYRNNAATYEECTCLIKADSGLFSLLLSDVRLKSANDKTCSRSKLYVNHTRFTCNDTKDDYDSVFEQTVVEEMTETWLMFVTDGNFVEPEMVYLTLKPQGQVEVSCQSKVRNVTPFKSEPSSKPLTVSKASSIDICRNNSKNFRSSAMISKLCADYETRSIRTQNKPPITVTFAIIVTACSTSVLCAVISLVAIALKRTKIWKSFRNPVSTGQEAACTNPRPESERGDPRYTECMQHRQGACGYSQQTANVCRTNQTLLHKNKEKNEMRDSGRYYDADVFMSPANAIYQQIKPELEYHANEYLELDQRLM